ncbi:MAG TPA: pilus assembly protein TadG-related protein, partial [Candidatus Obscuribacterales bacterium]
MTRRTQAGQLSGLILLAVALIAALAGAFIVDSSHLHAVRKELQRATDAAALAGAIDLYRAPDDVERHALQTAAENKADGKPVSDESPGMDVNINVTPPGESEPGRVEVTAQATVSHSLMHILGRSYDTVTARSVAGSA